MAFYAAMKKHFPAHGEPVEPRPVRGGKAGAESSLLPLFHVLRTRRSEISTLEGFFWGTQGRAELDLLIFRAGKPIGIEFKYSDAPAVTTSMKTAINDLGLAHLYVVHPGEGSFSMTEHITCSGLQAFLQKQL